MDYVLIPTRRTSHRVPVASPIAQVSEAPAPETDNPVQQPIETHQSPVPPTTNPLDSQSFLGEFNLVSALPESGREVLMQHTNSRYKDIDKWEIALDPDGYQRRFGDALGVVQLVSHVPKRLPSIAESTGDPDWMLVAQSVHQLWIQSTYKKSFLRLLSQWQTVQPGQFRNQCSVGHVLVPVAVFVDCLNRAGCKTLWLKAYGQKLPYLRRFISTEPAQVDHLLAEFNQWDIGKSFNSVFIWLFAPARPIKGMTHYPMIIPGSLDYGSVQVDVQYQNRLYSIKLYSRLVHVIKSLNSRLQGPTPKTVYGVRSKGKAALEIIQGLSKIRDKDLDGFRIEVTVQAKGLRDAIGIVEATPFLQPAFWLDPATFDPALAYLKLEAKIVSKKDLLANANWLYHQANISGIFDGDNSNKPSKRQIQGMTDVLAGFGWNPGQRKLTKSTEPSAWWLDTAQGGNELAVLEYLNQTFVTTTQKLELLAITRRHSSFGYIPCRKDTQHHYQVHDKANFRLRCGTKECSDRISTGEVIRWIATLICDGKIPLEAVKLGNSNQTAQLPIINQPPERPVQQNTVSLIRPPFKVPQVKDLVRLQVRPALYRTRWVDGDGNCMFAAFANAIGDTTITHKTVRRAAVRWARNHRDFIGPFVPEDEGPLPTYLQNMSRLGTWGDHPTLEAMARAYNVAVAVLKRTESGSLEWFKAGKWDEGTQYIGLYLEGEHYENLVGIDKVYNMRFDDSR